MNKLIKVIGDLGNPFQKKRKDLLTLDTKDIAYPNATERIHTHFERGRIRFDEFIHCLGSEENLTFYEPIIDGSALVSSLCPRTSNTFEEYAR